MQTRHIRSIYQDPEDRPAARPRLPNRMHERISNEAIRTQEHKTHRGSHSPARRNAKKPNGTHDDDTLIGTHTE